MVFTIHISALITELLNIHLLCLLFHQICPFRNAFVMSRYNYWVLHQLLNSLGQGFLLTELIYFSPKLFLPCSLNYLTNFILFKMYLINEKKTITVQILQLKAYLTRNRITAENLYISFEIVFKKNGTNFKLSISKSQPNDSNICMFIRFKGKPKFFTFRRIKYTQSLI